ncbi:MAG TPA: Gfo/Idh/MocA family oxidoreductase [Bryobacteraceae bacterium]|nr:Gfo/Idh/MocA family oxidoreductase [Bryobacteraceae bacterium]
MKNYFQSGLLLLLCGLGANAADFRLGIIGTDTSHVPVFTREFNDPTAPGFVPGFHVVAAYKGGSPDIPESATRVDGFANEVRDKYGVQIVPDIATLCSMVDGVLLESGDGRKHLEQARQVIAAHKPLFIDKPLASTLADVREIARLAKEAGVPWFSSSSLRYSDFTSVKSPDNTGVTVWGPGPLEEHHQLSLSWYGIHAVEMLYTMMGPGCVTVTQTSSPNSDVVVGVWKDGRIGVARVSRPYSDYGVVAFRGRAAIVDHPVKVDYPALDAKIAEFFRTGTPPVPNSETLEIYAFMDAAQRSKDSGGKPANLQ